jgi:hypothetical protein
VKNTSAIALAMAIMRATNGRVSRLQRWPGVEAFTKLNIIFVVDETMAAIRCGAPFSRQRKEYERANQISYCLVKAS